MKHLKRILALPVLAVLLLSFFAGTVYAEPVDQNRECTLNIYALCEGEPVPGMVFSVYRVGDIKDTHPFVETTGIYASCMVEAGDMEAEAWDTLAETLRSVVRAKGVKADNSCTSADNGSASCTLPCGLYLIVSNKIVTDDDDIYSASPFIVALPNGSSTEWNYSADAYPKIERSVVPKVDIRVMKKWDDAGFRAQRPTYITVYLYCDGELYDTQRLTERVSWRCEWKGLDPKHEWTVSEEPVEKYMTRIEVKDGWYVITNSCIPPYTPPTTPVRKLPQTGLLWWPVYVLAAVGVFFVLFGLIGMKLQRPQPAYGKRERFDWHDDEEK